MAVEDATDRKAGYWHWRVWRLALPLLLANVSTPLLGMVDAVIVGQLPDPALIGAVAVGALAVSLLFWSFGFLRMATLGLVAQAFGRRDAQALALVLGRGLLLSLAIAALLLLLQQPIRQLLLLLVDPGEATADPARLYYDIRIWSAPATLAFYVFTGWLVGVQSTSLVLLLVLFLNGANIILGLIFVLGFGWGLAGVAAATLTAEYLAAGLGWLLVKLKRRRCDAQVSRAELLNLRAMGPLLKVYGDLFLRTLALQLVLVATWRLGARQGEATLAANRILLQLHGFLAYAFDAFAFTAATLVGMAFGLRNRQAFLGPVEAAMLWAAIIAIGAAIAYAIAGPDIVSLFPQPPQMRQEAIRMLPWMVVIPLVSIWATMLDGVFIGALRTGVLRNATLASLVLYLGAVWALVPGWGNHGLWCAFALFLLARSATLALALPRLVRSVET